MNKCKSRSAIETNSTIGIELVCTNNCKRWPTWSDSCTHTHTHTHTRTHTHAHTHTHKGARIPPPPKKGKKLVIPAGGSGLDLTSAETHDKVGNGRVLGLARTVRNHDSPSLRLNRSRSDRSGQRAMDQGLMGA